MRIRDEYLHGSDLTGVVKKIEVTTGTGNNANQSVIKYIKADSEGGVVEVPIGDITGKAATASKLDNTSAIGSTTNPVYFTANGVPSACTYFLNATVPAGAANKILYYSATNTLGTQSYATLTSNLDVFTTATSSAAGKKGLVPAPAANQLGAGNFFLRADGVWTVIENKTPVLNGTATSLVTTGEKYNWNSAYNWYKLMTSGDTDGIINKWKEVEAFLANYGDSSTLAAELAKLVTLSTNQTITGVKTFSEVINGSITGNAGTANKLKNTVNINGVAFDGSTDITITAVATGGNSDTVGGYSPSDFLLKTEHETFESVIATALTDLDNRKIEASDIPTSLPANGGNADTVDGEHASAFAHIGAHNNLTASGNEFTFASNEFSGAIWFNYRTAGGANGNITEYKFGNGKGGELGTAIHSGNYNSYSPTLTGTGASGTWGINVSGNAATASNVSWSGVTNKPSSFTPSSHTHTKSEITDFPSSLPASDVYAWAKASTKPSYSWSEINSRPTNVSAFTNDAGYLTSHAYSYGSIDIYDVNGTKKTSNNTVSASVNTETLRLQEGANISITATNSGTSGSDNIKIAVTGITSNIDRNGYGQLALWYNGASSVSATLQSATYNEKLTVKAGSGIDFSEISGTANNDSWTISAIPYNCAIILNANSAKSLIKDSWSADALSVYLTSNGTSGGTSLAAGTYALWIEDRKSASGTPNYYSGTFTCAGNATAGRLDEIALHSSMATSADTNAPTRIFVATQISSTSGKHILRFCSLDSSTTNHYLTVKVNRII